MDFSFAPNFTTSTSVNPDGLSDHLKSLNLEDSVMDPSEVYNSGRYPTSTSVNPDGLSHHLKSLNLEDSVMDPSQVYNSGGHPGELERLRFLEHKMLRERDAATMNLVCICKPLGLRCARCSLNLEDSVMNPSEFYNSGRYPPGHPGELQRLRYLENIEMLEKAAATMNLACPSCKSLGWRCHRCVIGEMVPEYLELFKEFPKNVDKDTYQCPPCRMCSLLGGSCSVCKLNGSGDIMMNSEFLFPEVNDIMNSELLFPEANDIMNSDIFFPELNCMDQSGWGPLLLPSV